MYARLALLMGAALLCGGCEVPSDTGKPCVLVKQDPNDPTGQKSIFVTEADIQIDQDFISFGSVECENLVCVRTGGTALQTTGEGSATQVLGYCSKPCNLGITTDCAITSPQTAPDVKETLACRPLLLDQLALTDLKKNNPDEYARIFGRNESPNFCASKGVGTSAP